MLNGWMTVSGFVEIRGAKRDDVELNDEQEERVEKQ